MHNAMGGRTDVGCVRPSGSPAGLGIFQASTGAAGAPWTLSGGETEFWSPIHLGSADQLDMRQSSKGN